MAPRAGAAPAGKGAELVLEVENKTPLRDAFQFARLADGLRAAGRYVLEYELGPAAKPEVRFMGKLSGRVASGLPGSRPKATVA